MASRLAFIAACVLSVCIVGTNSLCMLCEDGVAGIKWHFHKVNSGGTTCVQQAINMASKVGAGTGECQDLIEEYREMCCGDDKPDKVVQVPTKPPTYNGPTGNYRTCDICRDGDYPGNKAMVINMLYLGVGSCAQYYDYGHAGLIPNHLCHPLQFFAYESCGCGEYNDANDSSSSAPTQRPTLKPSTTPTPASLPKPSQRPTSKSTEKPSPASPPEPTQRPTSETKTKSPVASPAKSTQRPTHKPTLRPTQRPTSKPTSRPTVAPGSLDSVILGNKKMNNSMGGKKGKH